MRKSTHISHKEGRRGTRKWDMACDLDFADLKETLTSSPVLIPPDWTRPFRCHVNASKNSVGDTLTQMDDNRRDHLISYYSRKLSDAEENFTANEREFLGLFYFLKRFLRYLEGASFDLFTDNQILNNFMTKPNLSLREARWLELFSQFGITKMSLKPGKVHFLSDVLSRAPHVISSTLQIGHFEVSQASLQLGFEKHYKHDHLFGLIMKDIVVGISSDPIQADRASRLLPSFRMKDSLLY